MYDNMGRAIVRAPQGPPAPPPSLPLPRCFDKVLDARAGLKARRLLSATPPSGVVTLPHDDATMLRALPGEHLFDATTRAYAIIMPIDFKIT